MVNIFDEIEIINKLMTKYNEEIENIQQYYLEMIQKTFESDIVYQNQDTCLEYMSFQEYCEITANNLKGICHSLNKEIKSRLSHIEYLKNLRTNKINKMLFLAYLSLPEIKKVYLSSFAKLKSSSEGNLLVSDGTHIYFNPEITLSLDEESTLIEFLNAKYWDEELSFYNFLNHEAQKRS